MSRLISTLLAGLFAAVVLSPVALAQDKKKEQAHKGTPEQGTVQKQDKVRKKDGSGNKKAEEKKK
jgi:Ni/Co efflux regulator RcnB